MKITHITLHRYDVQFVRPFVTSTFTLQSRTGLILTGEASGGAVGLGEISPLAGFSRETIDECVASAKEMVSMICGEAVPDSREKLRFWSDRHFNAPPSVVFGFETMLVDLAAQAAGVTMAQWYRKSAATQVKINAVIASAILESEVSSKYRQGYRTFKLKVGSLPVKEEIERIAVLRKVVGPEAKIRLDANRAYTLTDALDLNQAIETYKIDYIEEPLRNADLETLAQLRRQSSISVAIDETLIEVYNCRKDSSTLPLQDAAELGSFDVAIIKPSLMGGIGRTIEFCERLIESRKRIVVTSALDTGIGVTTALHIACALQLPDACGLDTAGVLENHLVDNLPAPLGGYLILPNQPGLGIGLSKDPNLRRYLTELYAD